MPFNYQICDGLIEITFHGKVTGDDLQQVLVKLAADESRLAVTPDRITNISDADTSVLLSSDLVLAAQERRRASLKNKVKSAFIATRSGQHGLTRMFMGHNQNPDISIQIFMDSVSAYNWLGREAKSDDETNA
jgi:hypothetical protein